MNIRKAVPADIDAIAAIYGAIHDEEEAGRTTTGWIRGIYPERPVAERAVSAGEMWVLEDAGVVRAAAIINHVQVPEYALATWNSDPADDEVLVLHTLVVDPAAAGHGYGTALVRFYEDRARHLECTVCRMDTNERNAAARRLYAHLGYTEVGIVGCTFNGIPDVRMVCLEKLLSR